MDIETTRTAPHPFHYYDWHETPEDLVGDSAIHTVIVAYLASVLQQLLDRRAVFIALNLNIYTAPIRKQMPIAPDIALYLGVQVDVVRDQIRSWCIYEPGRPPPAIVLEIASVSTWQRDLDEKPQLYADVGVEEYVLYDPNIPALLPGTRVRFWRREGAELVPVAPDSQGRYWSRVLERYLVSDGSWPRLIDREGIRSLTVEETARAARDAERVARRRERAAREQERAAKEAERAAKEAERTAKEAERAAKEAAWAKLRELGIDPTTLET